MDETSALGVGSSHPAAAPAGRIASRSDGEQSTLRAGALSIGNGSPAPPERAFSIADGSRAPGGALWRLLCAAAERALGLRELERIYARVRAAQIAGDPETHLVHLVHVVQTPAAHVSGGAGSEVVAEIRSGPRQNRAAAPIETSAAAARERCRLFMHEAIEALGVACHVGDDELERIPQRGPLVVVANHPFGAIEGLLLGALLARARPDVKIMANHLLARITELRECMIFVDPFGGRDAARRNMAPLREAMRWLKGDGALLVFPAGEVAHITLRRGLCEGPWSDDVARLIVRSGAAVLPVYVGGRNSLALQLLGLLHPRLRTAMLPRELLRQRGRRIGVRIGAAISGRWLARFTEAGEIAEFLRLRTLGLGLQAESKPGAGDASAETGSRGGPAPIEPPAPGDRLAAEIDALPGEARLVRAAEFDVYCCEARAIPATLREIGRLREITFRAVGEGTGRPVDLDRFDEHYLHLFVWHRNQREVVGAYRLGLADEITHRHGVKGLYTSTLFKYGRTLLRQLGPAIELGRSFVVAEHQRAYAPLLLLWKGIGRFVAMNPRYRTLFGAVSISAEYDSMTKRLLLAFLREHHFANDLARLARPRTPPALGRLGEGERRVLSRVVARLEDVEALVRECEAGRRGVPVLLRQYLKLGARLLGFNVDPAFGDCIDGLFCADLLRVDRAILDRYMGPEAAEAFLRCHSPAPAPLAAARRQERAEAAAPTG